MLPASPRMIIPVWDQLAKLPVSKPGFERRLPPTVYETETAVWLDNVPDEPVTVTVYVPLICVPVAVMVRVEVAVPPEVKETVVGFRVAVKPAGAFADSATLPEKPLRLLSVIVDVAEWLWERDIAVGLAETPKSTTLSVITTSRVREPLTPVTWMV